MVPGQCAAPGLGLGDRDADLGGEARQFGLGAGIEDPAAGDDQRRLGGAKPLGKLVDLARIGRWPADAPDAAFEEAGRIVRRLGLHILAEGQRGGTTGGGIQQGRHGAGQAVEDLLGPLDAVEIARHRAETVVGGDCGVGEALDLLQHRIRAAGGEDVAGQEEHRQAVDVGDARRRDHVQRARPDG